MVCGFFFFLVTGSHLLSGWGNVNSSAVVSESLGRLYNAEGTGLRVLRCTVRRGEREREKEKERERERKKERKREREREMVASVQGLPDGGSLGSNSSATRKKTMPLIFSQRSTGFLLGFTGFFFVHGMWPFVISSNERRRRIVASRAT